MVWSTGEVGSAFVQCSIYEIFSWGRSITGVRFFSPSVLVDVGQIENNPLMLTLCRESEGGCEVDKIHAI